MGGGGEELNSLTIKQLDLTGGGGGGGGGGGEIGIKQLDLTASFPFYSALHCQVTS